MNRQRKIISLFLSLIMVMSVFSIVPFTALTTDTDYPEIKIGETVTVTIKTDNDTAYLKYIPEEDMAISFSSVGDEDTYGTLYDEDMYVLESNDDDGSGMNFRIIYSVRAGRTYYFGVKYYGSLIGPMTVTLTQAPPWKHSGSTLTGYNGSETEIVIPSEIDEDTITSIGYDAFYGRTELTSVTIPDSVTDIDTCAFSGCKGLTNVTIPDSVTFIGEAAFRGCTNLKTVTVPASAKIEDHAFGFIYDDWDMVYEKIPGFTISGYTNSYAERYAKENGFDFISIGETNPFSYRINEYENTAEITGYSGSDPIMVIPAEIGGYPVAEIADNAFEDNAILTEAVIPDSVTDIGGYSFRNCKSLRSVTIPDSVTSIRYGTFEYCTAFTDVTIPDSITSIGNNAFFGCTGLRSVTIPARTEINDYAFGYNYDDNWNMVKIEGFTISSYTNSYAEIYAAENGFAFISLGEASPFVYSISDDNTVTITGYIGTDAEIEIPSEIDGCSVTGIDDHAFFDRSDLSRVTIPDSVASIGSDAFSGTAWYDNQPDGLVYAGKVAYKYKGTCPESVTIREGTLGIAEGAFEYCSELNDITIPASVKVIENHAFRYCRNLSGVHISDIEAWCHIEFVGNSLFDYADDFYLNGELITRLVIPDTITEIKPYAFQGNSNFIGITIPDSVTKIGYRAFFDCENLISVTIPASVTEIEQQAFGFLSPDWKPNQNPNFVIRGYAGTEAERYAKKSRIRFIDLTHTVSEFTYELNEAGEAIITGYIGTGTKIEIPSEANGSKVTSVNAYAFSGCTSLTSVKIPDSVTSIGTYAFFNCLSLTDITVPDSVVRIDSNAFYNTAWYSSQPDGLVYAGKMAYKMKGTCPAAVTIKDGTKGIAGYAFYGCSELTSITIPDSVANIGYSAFNNCDHLSTVHFGKGVESIEYRAFYNCTDLSGVTVPARVRTIGDNALGYYHSQRYYTDFARVSDFTIYSYSNGALERYANDNGFAFVDLDAPTPRLGDADGDGELTLMDVTHIQHILALPSAEISDELLRYADIDGNGLLEIIDATFIQRHLALMETPYKIG